MAVPQSHIDALQNQAINGTPQQQAAAQQALKMHGVDSVPAEMPGGSGSTTSQGQKPVDNNQPDLPVKPARPPVLSEPEAKRLYIEAGGDPADFYYDPTGKTPDPNNRKAQQARNRTPEQKAASKARMDDKTRRDLARTALEPALGISDRVDINELAKIIHGDPANATMVRDHLVNLGYSPNEAKGLTKAALSRPKYSYDPDTLKEHLEHETYETQGARGLLLDILPITGTARLKKQYESGGINSTESAIIMGSALLDVLSVVPVVRGASIGARSATGIGRATKLKGALKGAWQGTVAEVSAPITAVAHPVETVKGTVKGTADLIENIVHPYKIPDAALEMKTTTVRLPANAFESEDVAKAARDEVTQMVMEGTGGSVKAGDIEAELGRTAIQKAGPLAVHTTPDVRPFAEGVTIEAGREGGLFVAPNVHTRFADASAFGDMPKGGIPGAVLIRDEKIISKLKGSDKIFKGTAEVERVIEAGTKLPPPSQVLFTRDQKGNILRLLVIGDKYTPVELAKFKLAGAADTLKNIFVPSAELKRGGKVLASNYDEILETRREITKIQDELAEARRAGNDVDIKAKEVELKRLEGDLKRQADGIRSEPYGSSGRLARADFALDYSGRKASPLQNYEDLYTGTRKRNGRVNLPPVDFTRGTGRIDGDRGQDRGRDRDGNKRTTGRIDGDRGQDRGRGRDGGGRIRGQDRGRDQDGGGRIHGGGDDGGGRGRGRVEWDDDDKKRGC